MASLQTLRNKGGVIVAVVIGLALLAFLLGDLLTSGNSLFNPRNVGEIDGTNISAQQYQEKVNYLTEMTAIGSGNSSTSPEQSEMIQNEAWGSFIRIEGFLPQTEKLGIITTDETISELFFGKYPSQILTQMFADPQTGAFNAEYLQAFINNVEQGANPQLSMYLNYLQREVAQQNVMSIYKTLVDKACYTTTLEAEMAAQLNAKTYTIQYAFKPFTAIADSTVKVSESEIKEYYNNHKNAFKQNISRTINYVMFEAQPSNEDFKLASQTIETMAGELAKSQNPLQYALANTQGQLDERFYAIDDFSEDKAAFAFSGDINATYGPVLNGNVYSVSRISDKKIVADTMSISQIIIAGDQNKLADSIVDAIQKGGNWAELVASHSLDPQGKENGGEVPAFDPQSIAKEFSKELIGAKAGQIKVVKFPQQIIIIKVNNVVGEKERVQLATINYNVEPSSATRNNVYARASAFKAKAGKNITDFMKTVADSSLAPRKAVVAPNQKEIQGIKDSRELASWAYNKGEQEGVSSVMTFGDNFVVAALAEIADDKVAPLKKVQKDIENVLITEKKGEMISKEFEGKTIVALQANGITIENADEVNFKSYMIGNTGFDPIVGGAVAALSDGQTSKPIVGLQGVYLVQVVSTVNNNVNVEIERSRIQAEAEQGAFSMAYRAFIEGLNIEDVRYKYF